MIGALLGVIGAVVVVAAGVVVGRRRSDAAAPPAESSDAVVTDEKAVAQKGGLLRDGVEPKEFAAAQVQDHGGAARNLPNSAAQTGGLRRDQSTAAEDAAARADGLAQEGGDLRDDPPERPPPEIQPSTPAEVLSPSGAPPSELRVWLGLRVDGTTAWVIRPGVGGFHLLPHLRAALRRKARAFELVDPHGEVIEFALERAKGGGVVLLTGALRLELRNDLAEIQIRAQAIETEGLASWFLRELPRAVWWLLGVRLPEHTSTAALADDLHALGVATSRIEICLDAQGLALYPGIAHHLVGGPAKRPYVPRPGVESGVEIGKRSANDLSIALYDKAAELASQRGPAHGGLLGMLTEAGYREGDPWERIEVRLHGQALRLVADGELLDATHPGAALDDALLGRFWWDALTRIWLADASAGNGRMRDNPMHPLWAAARAAGLEPGSEIPKRTRRAAIERQLQSTREHCRAQLGRTAAAIAVLDGARSIEDVPERARAALEDVLADPQLGEHFVRARARYRVLLDGLDDDGPGNGGAPSRSGGPGNDGGPSNDGAPSSSGGPGNDGGPSNDGAPSSSDGGSRSDGGPRSDDGTRSCDPIGGAPSNGPRDDLTASRTTASNQPPTNPADPTMNAPLTVPEDPPTWTRRPIDAAARWRRGDLPHHRFANVVRMMTADERARTRASLERGGYDREWPIVLYQGQILDGRNRDALARALWQQTGRDDLIPSFVEFVPDDPARGDEAALLYVQQRLIAARDLGEGERVAAAFKLYEFYRECGQARPAKAKSRADARSLSAKTAAASMGVSARSVERYAFIRKHAVEALGADRSQALLAEIDAGDTKLRTAEREVKRALAQADALTEADARPVPPTVDVDLPATAGDVILEAPGVRLAKVDALDLLRSLPDASVETVFFDGPYLLGDTGTTNKAGRRVPVSPGEWDAKWTSPEHYREAFLEPVVVELERVLAPTGEVWASGTRHVIFTVAQALSQLPSFRLYQDICWKKTTPPPRLHPQSGWTDDHELVLWYRAKAPKHARRDVTEAKALIGVDTATWPLARPGNLEYRFGKHPTQKPERLLEAILTAHAGLVVDFCAGSCTTAVAALRCGRPVICGDLSAERGYLGTGKLRVLAELDALDDVAGPCSELGVDLDEPDADTDARLAGEHLAAPQRSAVDEHWSGPR